VDCRCTSARDTDDRSGDVAVPNRQSCPLASIGSAAVGLQTVTDREHPTEDAQDRLLAPAVGTAGTSDRTHALNEPADQGEEEIHRQETNREPPHGWDATSRVRCRPRWKQPRARQSTGTPHREAHLATREGPFPTPSVARWHGRHSPHVRAEEGSRLWGRDARRASKAGAGGPTSQSSEPAQGRNRSPAISNLLHRHGAAAAAVGSAHRSSRTEQTQVGRTCDCFSAWLGGGLSDARSLIATPAHEQNCTASRGASLSRP
jgi:hypothetical protein